MSIDSVLPAVYDPHSKKWVFTRQHGLGTILRPVGDCRTYIFSSLGGRYADSSLSSGKRVLHVDRARHWSRYLMHDVPELAPALDLVPDIIEESHIITASSEVNDPTVGRLMDVGSATIADHGGGGGQDGIVQSLTYATGITGSEIGIARIVDEKYTFQDEEGQERQGVQLTAPGLGDAYPGYRFVGQVRQICTARQHGSEKRYRPLFAVRTANSSSILKQEYVPHQPRRKFAVTSLLEIPVGYTGNVPHSDVTFSPYNNNHLGIVDERGVWSVWDMTLGGFKPTPVATGRELTSLSHGNSWGNIQWGADVNSLMVANRSSVGLFDIRAQPPGISFIQVDNSVQHDWVLDTAYIPTNPHHALILTSTSLLWVDIRVPGKRLLSQDHYRHTDDISLKMELFTLPSRARGEDEVTALIYSRMNPLVSAFQLGYTGSVPTWLDNPYLWSIDKKVRPMAMSVLPASLNRHETGEEACVSCFTISRDMVVRGQVYTSASPDMGEPIPLNSTTRERSGMGEQEEEAEKDMEPQNWEDDDKRLILADMSELYKYVFAEDDEALKTTEDGQAVERLKQALQEALHNDPGIRDGEGRRKGVKTLLEVRRPERLFDDLESLCSNLNQLLIDNNNNTSNPATLSETKYLIPRCERFPFRSEADDAPPTQNPEPQITAAADDIQALYQRLFSGWVAPLPPHIPTKVRLRRERLARMIATETYLSGRGILHHHQEPTTPGSGESSTPSLPPSPTPNQPETLPTTFLLHKYTPLLNVLPKPSLPSSMTRILEQWDIGEDPDDFEYTADGAPTRRKHHTKSKKHQKAQKGTGGGAGGGISLSQGLTFGGSQPAQFALSASATQPSTPSGSGAGGWGGARPMTPARTPGRTQSPSEKEKRGGGAGGVGMAVSMSQVERGRFGGRKPVKKKRKQGF